MSGWILLAALTAALAVWGWRASGDELAFFAASRRAGPFLAGLAGTAAGLSAFVFVGGPGLFASIGVASLWVILSAPLTGALQCWAVGERVVALAARHGCVTVPDLVAARFGEGWPRGLAATAVVVGGVATLAVQVAGVAVLAEVLLGLPGWQTALLATLATTVYTAAGGMRAGLVAEAAQGLVMVVAALALARAGLAAAGGPTAAVRTLAELRPELLAPWSSSGATASLGLFLLFALGPCAQPHYLQKFLLLRDARALRWLPLVMTGALLAILTVWLGLGLGGTALWLRGELTLTRPDQLAPSLVAHLARPGLRWLTVAAVLAAVMSTAATLLNLVAAALTRDLPRALGRALPSSLSSARVATVVAAAVAAALALVSERPVALLGILGWGTFTAALLPVMMVGLAWPGATRRGAVAALVVGPLVQLGLEAARLAGVPLGVTEPGLSGAAVGCLALVAGSLRLGGETAIDPAPPGSAPH